MNDISYEIKAATNGFIIDKCVYTKQPDGMTDYKSYKTICNHWDDVVEYLHKARIDLEH